MSNRVIQITNKGLIEPQHKCEHEPYEYNKYEVTKRSKESQCYVAIYEIPPKKANYPYHYHLKNEEVFYIISGSGLMEIRTFQQGILWYVHRQKMVHIE